MDSEGRGGVLDAGQEEHRGDRAFGDLAGRTSAVETCFGLYPANGCACRLAFSGGS